MCYFNEMLMPISSSGFPDSPDSDDSRFQEETGSDVAVEEGRPKLKEPAKYAVLLLNDDYTTMDFVVDVLQRFFRKSRQEAAQIMLRVHQEGQGLAGVYVFEIAETKVAQVQEYARAHGFPLRCALEPLL